MLFGLQTQDQGYFNAIKSARDELATQLRRTDLRSMTASADSEFIRGVALGPYELRGERAKRLRIGPSTAPATGKPCVRLLCWAETEEARQDLAQDALKNLPSDMPSAQIRFVRPAQYQGGGKKRPARARLRDASASVKPPNRALHRPLLSGISVSPHTVNGAGTIGTFVEDVETPNGVYLLSCLHVLLAQAGTSAVQPGLLLDGGDPVKDRVGDIMTIPKSEAFDAALAKLLPGLRFEHRTIDKSDGMRSYGRTVIAPEVNMRVIKYGRTTGGTRGVITEIDAANTLGDGKFVEGHFIIERMGSTAFSQPGDAGSLILAEQDNRNPLGLLFAGDDVTTTFAMPLQGVFDALKVRLAKDQ